MKRGNKILSWFWIILGVLYFFLPLVATFIFSLKAKLHVLSFQAYANIFNDPMFISNFLYSVLWAVLTIIVGILLLVPTATLIRLRVPKMRSAVEFITLLPFVIPAIVFVFGLVRTFSQPPLLIVNSPAVLVAGYLVLAMPYMYRAVDTGLRSIDVKTLTEAGQSLGAGWGRILFDIILPNIRVAILSGSFLTFAIVIGELVLASYLAKPAFAPYMAYMIQQKAYEPAAMAIVSFALTWGALGIIQWVGRGSGQAQVGGGH
ncbi:MAG: ABC transporter permease subunit [Anaerolineales bacterium]|jgi:putative spermidine/putrescine transport system permease protein